MVQKIVVSIISVGMRLDDFKYQVNYYESKVKGAT